VLADIELMAPATDPVQIGDWLVDPRDDSLKRGAERVKLEPRTMRLLMRLAQAPGTVVSHDELLESVWTGVVVGPASVYQSMSQLRKLLGDTDDPPRYIETVARKGYRLLATVGPPAPRVPGALAPGCTAAAGGWTGGRCAGHAVETQGWLDLGRARHRGRPGDDAGRLAAGPAPFAAARDGVHRGAALHRSHGRQVRADLL
jgi:DNA-binding winged helix-turn-helix (wHTH) protein